MFMKTLLKTCGVKNHVHDAKYRAITGITILSIFCGYYISKN